MIRREVDLYKEHGSTPNPPVAPVINWVCRNNALRKLYKALAKTAPLTEVRGYQGEIDHWIALPPSGEGNEVVIIMGRDRNGDIRCVAGNSFGPFSPDSHAPPSDKQFFREYDANESRVGRNLHVASTISKVIGMEGGTEISGIREQYRSARIMPINIVALTDNTPLYSVAPTVVERYRQADFAYECLEEF